jgi:chromosome partitioning protein
MSYELMTVFLVICVMGKIIGVCNQKGGTGKTTTAINIASYLALSGKEVLLIDMDPQGNATSGVGFDNTDKNSIYDVIAGTKTLQESIYPTQWPHFSLMPSTVALTGSEIELVNVENRELQLKRELDKIKDNFSYLIIDAPPSLGLLTVNVLCACDSLVIPVQCEYYALEGVAKLVNTIELVRQRFNPDLEIEGILLTMADFRTRLSLQVIEEVRGFFKEKAFNSIVPRNIRLAEAPSFGQPIHFYDQYCVGAKAYLNLAQEILKEPIKLN